MGFLPAKDMSGYGPAGRGAIIPERIPRKNPQQKNFCTTHLHFENRSFVEFIEKNGWYINSCRGVSGGVSGGISVRARPADTPDIALAGKNPMSVALTERYHKSQDNYLLGKNYASSKTTRTRKVRFLISKLTIS